MQIRPSLFLGSFALLLAGCGANGVRPVVQGIEIKEYGIYSAEVVDRLEDKHVAGGSRDSIGRFTLVVETNRIPAKLGVRFGFRYFISGTPEGTLVKLKMVGKYPPPGLADPVTGKLRRQDEYFLETPVGNSYTSYSFDSERELIPGEWTLEIWWGGKKMAEKTFTVFKP